MLKIDTAALKTHIKGTVHNRAGVGKRFIKWILISVFVGVVMGAVGSAFRIMLEYVTELRGENGWLLYCLPLGGLFIVYCYKELGFYHDKGTNLVLMAIRDNEKLTLKTMLLIFSSTIITHLFGGSSGREGAALQIGGSFGASFGRLLHLDEKDMRVVTMCGMSAGFSAIFGTPVTAAIFSMEVTSVGIMYYSAIVPSVVSALTAHMFTELIGMPSESFELSETSGISISSVLKVLALAVLCAIAAELFVILLKSCHHLFQRLAKNKFIRIILGSALIILISLLVGTRYNGLGIELIQSSFTEKALPWDFALKALLTAITLGCGFKGGEIVPAMFVGATFGNVMSGILGLDMSFGAAIGLVAVFCGVTNCPLTSLVLSAELFGGKGFVLFALAAAVAYLLSGYRGLYNEQKIVYSKSEPKFINKQSNT